MVLGDALALGSWTGDGHPPIDGLADVAYWGGYAEAAHRQFGGDLILRHGSQVRGWLGLPLDDAKKLGDALNDWEGDEQGRGVMVAVDERRAHGRPATVHAEGCPSATDRAHPPGTMQALDALACPGTTACTVCDTAEVLLPILAHGQDGG